VLSVAYVGLIKVLVLAGGAYGCARRSSNYGRDPFLEVTDLRDAIELFAVYVYFRDGIVHMLDRIV